MRVRPKRKLGYWVIFSVFILPGEHSTALIFAIGAGSNINIKYKDRM